MGLENTITEQDMEVASRQSVQGFRTDNNQVEPDLAVDGLSEGIIAKIFRIITFRRA